LIVLIQELIQIHSCGVLIRHKRKGTNYYQKSRFWRSNKNDSLTSYKPEKINNERVSSTTHWVDNVQYTHTRWYNNEECIYNYGFRFL